MATVERFKGYRVVIYSNDHRPPHVHVMGADGEVVFRLQCPGGPALLREVYGLSHAKVSDIARQLDHRHEDLCRHWRRIDGYH